MTQTQSGKRKPAPIQRSPEAQARAEAAARAAAQRAAIETDAQQLAQIVNLLIAGHTYETIGLAIGATPDEVEKRLTRDAARYVRTQPALRTYVRNFISEKYLGMLDAVYPKAIDATHSMQLENVDRADRILARMARLHGAEAPTQTEVKVESTPEAVEALVQQMAAQVGLDYDVSIFDSPAGGTGGSVPGEVLHAAHEASERILEVSRNQVEESDGDDEL